MRKNYMAEVAKLLGVELGEPFKITSDTQGDYPGVYQNYYRFTENNCIEFSDDGVEWKTTITAVLLKHIFVGDIRIIKLPWKPQKNDTYYMPTVTSTGKCIKLFWTGSKNDEYSYQQGLVYKTSREAIELAEEMLDIARKRFAMAKEG